MTKGSPHGSVSAARLRKKYAAYPGMVSQGLSFVQISEALGIDRKKLQKVKDAFDREAYARFIVTVPAKDRPTARAKRRPVETKAARQEKLRNKYPTFPELVAQGHTRPEIMQALGVGISTISSLKRAFGMDGKVFPRVARAPKQYPGIDEALRHGGSYAAIGARFGICRERVRQIAKASGIEKAQAKRGPGPRKRTASGLTLYQHRLTERYPDILNPSIVPCDITGPNKIMVYKIRKILGISYSACHVSLSERIVSVIDRLMTIPEIASALGSEPTNTLHMYLSMHAKNGRIKRISRGVYVPAKDLL